MFFVGRGNSPGVPAGQRSRGAVAVFGDQLAQLLVDRHQRVAFHLVVDVAQIRRALGVGDDAVAAQPQRVGDPQPAAHQDDRDQPVGRVGESGEVVRMLELGHDMFGQRPRQPFFAFRVVLGEEHRVCGKCCVPTVLADRGEEPVEQPDVGAAALGMKADRRAGRRGSVPAPSRSIWSMRSTPMSARNRAKRVSTTTGRPPPASRPSPVDSRHRTHRFVSSRSHGWRDPGEPQRAVAVVAESAHPPDIARVLGFPAAGLGQVGDHPAGVAEEPAGASVVDRQPSSLVPGVFVVVEQRAHVPRRRVPAPRA